MKGIILDRTHSWTEIDPAQSRSLCCEWCLTSRLLEGVKTLGTITGMSFRSFLSNMVHPPCLLPLHGIQGEDWGQQRWVSVAGLWRLSEHNKGQRQWKLWVHLWDYEDVICVEEKENSMEIQIILCWWLVARSSHTCKQRRKERNAVAPTSEQTHLTINQKDIRNLLKATAWEDEVRFGVRWSCFLLLDRRGTEYCDDLHFCPTHISRRKSSDFKNWFQIFDPSES